MSKTIYTGGHTTENSENIVVFIIGMRIHKRLAIHKWLPVFLAMPRMIKELYTQKDSLGFISMESYFGMRTTAMIQYWNSTEELHAYARKDKHLTAWRNFNKKVANNDAVGVYHETYQLKKGEYEAIYRNMPQYGLGKALEHMPITPKTNSSRKRLSSQSLTTE